MRRAFLLLVLLSACGSSTAGMSGPTLSGRIQDESEPVPEIQSNDILARDMVASRAVVRHILIGWSDLQKTLKAGVHERARNRTREEADALAVNVLERVRAGEDMEALMRAVSEDMGSATTGQSYVVTVDADLVFEFKRLGMRLKVGEAGLVQSMYGWHVIKRFE